MPLDRPAALDRLKKFDFAALFTQVLGWDWYTRPETVSLADKSFVLNGIAEKRGMVAYVHQAPEGESIPAYAVRRKIERQVAKIAHEHIVIFTDSLKSTQIWQWVKREPGKPEACREHLYQNSQSGEALLQKLDSITFILADEDALTLTEVTRRARKGFDLERVTKRFYDEFRRQHAAFLKLITGIAVKEDQEWYASVMLNRMMFVYFVQRKGFLDGDKDYLRNRLALTRRKHGEDEFYSFYRYFLLRLFHEGLGNTQRTPELEQLLGRIPFLNGGVFAVHELERPERYGDQIAIPDEAFEAVFDFFDKYQWHLDERPLRKQDEINPDVLGYIFEKYINQKQMGAYYTKEDITEYISKSTVLPFLFDAARLKCKIAFENPKGPAIWDLLKSDPDRYIYAAVRHGTDRPLPQEIAVGVNPPTLHQPVGEGPVQTLELRKGWNKPAPSEYAMPTETWREVVARRTRYEEIRNKLANGEVRDINDFITLNLDIRQFAQDVIENCEGPELLRALWHAIEKVTILDPTCGSGAFLFAALNILEPLYEACLDRMEAFVDDLDRSGAKHRPEKYSDFRKVLDRVAAHPNRRYFVFKSIILNNLFGVDIMEEAVEICKLRLFLKLAAQVEPDVGHPNLGIEPLPDIDFNIKAGNTLVGYVSLDEIREGAKGDTERFANFEENFERIRTMATELQEDFDVFRDRQVEGDGSVPAEHKVELHKRLKGLQEELNRYLAAEYGVATAKKKAYAEWLKSHQPFHWFAEFYGILSAGGFDVVIGNPPYVEYKDVKKHYKALGYVTEECGNLYAMTWERSVALAGKAGQIGLIIPVASVCTDRYMALRTVWISSGCLVISNFNDRPGKLFDGLEHIRLSIVLLAKSQCPRRSVHTTTYTKWLTAAREQLFLLPSFAETTDAVRDGSMPKLGSKVESSILRKVYSSQTVLQDFVSDDEHFRIYYTRKLSWFVQILSFIPSIHDEQGATRTPSELKDFSVATEQQRNAFLCVLNATLFYWFLVVWSDCRNLNKREVLGMPFDFDKLDSQTRKQFDDLAVRLMKDFQDNSRVLEMKYADWGMLKIQCIYPKFSKDALDQIDQVLARHYAFTEEELDFVINFDIKYRMGRDAESGDE